MRLLNENNTKTEVLSQEEINKLLTAINSETETWKRSKLKFYSKRRKSKKMFKRLIKYVKKRFRHWFFWNYKKKTTEYTEFHREKVNLDFMEVKLIWLTKTFKSVNIYLVLYEY